MATKPPKPTVPRHVETLQPDEARRKNIPTAGYQSVLELQKVNHRADEVMKVYKVA